MLYGTRKRIFSHNREKIGATEVTVAVTPTGYADAIHEGRVFAMPEQKRMPFSHFLDELSSPKEGEVHYVQEQNSNLTTEFEALLGDVEELEWAREAFGDGAPDAVNFWMGDHRAVTSTHKDPYENIYCVVRGYKDFILFPPTDLPWLYYQDYPQGVFQRTDKGDFEVKLLEDQGNFPAAAQKKSIMTKMPSFADKIPWISVDPVKPDLSKHPDYRNATPYHVRVESGDALYLPSLWFHHLRQSHGCVAVNFWYDMQFDARYAYLNALSQMDSLRRGRSVKTDV